ncbi:MAG TPA: 2-hydroxyacid dehydrogenase [Candidatus Obscuribacterales bacterium]
MRVLLCNESYPQAVERLNALLPGHQVSSCRPDSVGENLAGIDVIIPSVAKIDAELIEKGAFGFIQQLGVGLDSVDIGAATKCGVYVAKVPGAGSGNAESVAELAIMFMLVLSRRLFQARENIAKGVFFRPGGKSLLGKTVCIVGFGDIGTELAKRLLPFGITIKAVKRRPAVADHGEFANVGIYGADQLADAFSDADFIILALPETPETASMINRRTIEMMKQGVFLINVGRGGLIDDEALLEGLRSGQIAGCGLDVFRNEPMDPNDPLFKENVVATPHIGGNTDASFLGVTAAIADNVKRFASGQKPLHVVNAPARPRARIS